MWERVGALTSAAGRLTSRAGGRKAAGDRSRAHAAALFEATSAVVAVCAAAARRAAGGGMERFVVLCGPTRREHDRALDRTRGQGGPRLCVRIAHRRRLSVSDRDALQ